MGMRRRRSFISINLISGAPSHFIDSNTQSCNEGLVMQEFSEPISNHPSCFAESCNTKCIDPLRLSPDFCGSEFDVIDSNTDRCCNGLEMQTLVRRQSSNQIIDCTAESGFCDVKCVNPERIQKEKTQSIVNIIAYAIFLIGWISWMFIGI